MRVTLNEDSQAEWNARQMEHIRYEYDLKPDDLVIDIGAYRGEWSEEIFKRYGCRIIAIEPTDSILGFQHGEVINKAASTHDGKLKFGGAFYYTSSFEDASHEYECFDVNPLLEQHPEIALVKCNVEGHEYPLLRHIIDAGLHKRIRNLQVQFHQIEGEPYKDWYREIFFKLDESHELAWRFAYCWEGWKRKDV